MRKKVKTLTNLQTLAVIDLHQILCLLRFHTLSFPYTYKCTKQYTKHYAFSLPPWKPTTVVKNKEHGPPMKTKSSSTMFNSPEKEIGQTFPKELVRTNMSIFFFCF